MAGALRALLADHQRRHPAMAREDQVKLVFQALMGVGHLLAGREQVTAYLRREMAALAPDPVEPLTETVGPDWFRLNLRRAMAEGLTPEAVAGLMLASTDRGAHTRADVRRFCEEAVPDADLSLLDRPDWLPSHSAAYRAAERPAYRLISADWLPCLEAVCLVSRTLAAVPRPLVTLDGPCASGKTTLAGRLASVFAAAVAHTDDYVIPHARKTPERLAVPGGNCDAERLLQDVLLPWKEGRAVRYRPYDCAADRICPAQALPDAPLLILEGSYANLPGLRALADARLFLSVPRETRLSRLKERESAGSFQRYLDRWIPLEEAYFSAYGLPDREICVITCT